MTAPRPTPATTPPPGLAGTLRRRWLAVGAVVVALALLVAGWMGFSYLFLATCPAGRRRADDPTPSAAATARRPRARPPTRRAGPADAAEPADDRRRRGSGALDGTWTVDPSIGSFSDFSGSFVGYRVEEELANIGAATAVGRTPDVTGSVTFDGTTVTAVEMTADLTTLQSDNDRRDGQLRSQALETNTFPTATFTLTEPIQLDAVPADGEVVSATATGDLTLHGQTRSRSRSRSRPSCRATP